MSVHKSVKKLGQECSILKGIWREIWSWLIVDIKEPSSLNIVLKIFLSICTWVVILFLIGWGIAALFEHNRFCREWLNGEGADRALRRENIEMDVLDGERRRPRNEDGNDEPRQPLLENHREMPTDMASGSQSQEKFNEKEPVQMTHENYIPSAPPLPESGSQSQRTKNGNEPVQMTNENSAPSTSVPPPSYASCMALNKLGVDKPKDNTFASHKRSKL